MSGLAATGFLITSIVFMLPNIWSYFWNSTTLRNSKWMPTATTPSGVHFAPNVASGPLTRAEVTAGHFFLNSMACVAAVLVLTVFAKLTRAREGQQPGGQP